MFLGHFAVGLAGKRAAPHVSLAAWFAAVQLADLLWPLFLMAGVEHVRIAPGITAFTPLDFYDYPITHSLIGAAVLAMLFAGGWMLVNRQPYVALLLFCGVLSHWVLDVVTHRPDLPVLPRGPYVGLGLWNSVPATLVVEVSMFVGGLILYARMRRPSASFWILMGALFGLYLAVAFGPPPPSVEAIAWSGLAAWLFVPWAWWADRNAATSGPAS